jgi:hypothetical protein
MRSGSGPKMALQVALKVAVGLESDLGVVLNPDPRGA